MGLSVALAGLCGAAMTPGPVSGQEAPAAGSPEDVADLDGIVRAFYEVVSGPAGEAPDRARDEWIHHPDALVGVSGVDEEGAPFLRTMTLAGYHDAFGGPRSEPFYEREIHREVHRFGNIAQVWSTYASSREPEGDPFARGINAIQLYHDGQRWWITSWIFDGERAGNPIPEGYLPD